MKRSALILLTFVYLISCLGVAVNRFYCCGQLASVKLVYGGEASKDNRSSKKKASCCRHEYKTFKISDTHFNAPCYILNSPSPVILPTFGWVTEFKVTQLPYTGLFIQHKVPPGIADLPLYTLNCTYRV